MSRRSFTWVPFALAKSVTASATCGLPQTNVIVGLTWVEELKQKLGAR